MADDYNNETYSALLNSLGPEQSLILIDKLTIDIKNIRRGLQAALSTKATELLNEPSHVLISLTGVVGADELHELAKDINNFDILKESTFPQDRVKSAIEQLNIWLDFLKSDKADRE